MKEENIHAKPAADFHSIYANNVAFAMSAFDVSFIFGEITGADGDIINVEQKLRVTMSPQHAKILAMVLVQNLKAYENSIGPINIPTNIVAGTEVGEKKVVGS